MPRTWYEQTDVIERPHIRKIASLEDVDFPFDGLKVTFEQDVRYEVHELTIPSWLDTVENATKFLGVDDKKWIGKEVALVVGTNDTIKLCNPVATDYSEREESKKGYFEKIFDLLGRDPFFVPCGSYQLATDDQLDETPEDKREKPIWKVNKEGEWRIWNPKKPALGHDWQDKLVSGASAARWFENEREGLERTVGWRPLLAGFGVIDIDVDEGEATTDQGLQDLGDARKEEIKEILNVDPVCIIPTRSPGGYHIIVKADSEEISGDFKYGEIRCSAGQAVMWRPDLFHSSLSELEFAEAIDWVKFSMDSPASSKIVGNRRGGTGFVGGSGHKLNFNSLETLAEALKNAPHDKHHNTFIRAANAAFHLVGKIGTEDEINKVLDEGIEKGPFYNHRKSMKEWRRILKDCRDYVRETRKIKDSEKPPSSDDVEGHPDFDPNSEKHKKRRNARSNKTIENEISAIRSVAATTVADRWIYDPEIVAFGIPHKDFGGIPVHERRPGSSVWRKILIDDLDRRLESEISEQVKKLCGEANVALPKQLVTANAIGSCRRQIQVRAVPKTVAKARESNPNLMKNWDMATGELLKGVAFKNSLVTIDLDGNLTKSPLKQSYYITSAMDFECPDDISDPKFPYAWWNYGMSSLGEKRFKLLNEALGMAIFRDTRPQRMMFIRGKGGSGKGTFTKLLRDIMGGSKNALSLNSPAELDNRFSLGMAPGKTILKIDDGGKQPFGNDSFARSFAKGLSHIKNITGEDDISCEIKNRQAVNEKLELTVWYCSNHRVRFPMDLSEIEAWERRLLIVVYNHPDTIEHVDLGLLDKLKSELPLIVIYAMNQYSLMLGRSTDKKKLDWTEPESSRVERKRINDAVLGLNGQFIIEQIEEKNGAGIHYDDIYTRFEKYADIEFGQLSKDEKSSMRNKISDIFQLAVHDKRWKGVDGKRRSGVKNIQFKLRSADFDAQKSVSNDEDEDSAATL